MQCGQVATHLFGQRPADLYLEEKRDGEEVAIVGMNVSYGVLVNQQQRVYFRGFSCRGKRDYNGALYEFMNGKFEFLFQKRSKDRLS